MDRMLQAIVEAQVSKNGDGNEYRIEGYHPVRAYRSGEHKQASLSSVNRGEVREKGGGARGIMPGKRRQWRRREVEMAPEWWMEAVD